MQKINTRYAPIPPTFSRFFWDVDLSKIHVDTHASYIIERLMIWGNEEAWNWAHHTYSVHQIQEVIKTSKTLDAKTAVFFAYIYNVPQKEVQCLRRQSLLKRIAFWQR